MKYITLKRGDTINWLCTYKEGGAATTLPTTVTAQIRQLDGALVTDMTVTIVDAAAGTFRLSAPGTVEELLPIGTLALDFLTTDADGSSVHSDTVYLLVGQPVTFDTGSGSGGGANGADDTLGTVTSVALTAPAEFSVSGSPITVDGTIDITWAEQSPNKVLAGPSSGSVDAAPVFRALVAADIPTLDYNDLDNLPDLSTFEGMLSFATSNDFPTTGADNTVYYAKDTGFLYRWAGTAYAQLTDQTAIWGMITGTLSDQTDLGTALAGKVDTVTGKGLSTNDFTDADVTTLGTALQPSDVGTAAALDTGTASGQIPTNADLPAIPDSVSDILTLLQPTVTGSATFTASSKNIALTGIGATAMDLAAGDYIKITGTTNNNDSYTVGSVTDNDNVVVNEALTDETATATTVQLLAKASMALPTTSVTRAWTNQESNRDSGTTYTNSSGNEIMLLVYGETVLGGGKGGLNVNFSATVDGNEILNILANDYVGIVVAAFAVPDGATYSATSQIHSWWELA